MTVDATRAAFSSLSPDFVAVILAATAGARLFPLTSKQNPKSALPVAGIPLLIRLLNVVEACGFQKCVVAIAKDDTVTIPLLKQVSEPESTQPCTTLRFKNRTQVTVFEVTEDCAGSAQALVQMEEASNGPIIPPESHIVVIPCDLVVMDPSALTNLVDVHRQANVASKSSSIPSACTILLADVGEQDEHGIPLNESAKQKKGGLAREEEDIEYIALNRSTPPRVIWKKSKIDVEQDEDLVGKAPKINLPKARLRSGISEIRKDWSDLHCYVLSPWVRRFWLCTRDAVSLQTDVLPLLVSRQFRGIVASFGKNAMKDHKDVIEQILPSPGVEETLIHSHGVSTQEYAVAAHVLQQNLDSTKVAALRASTIPAYLYACRELAALAVDGSASSNPCLTLPKGTTVQAKFQSILLPDSKTGDKVTCKSSTIGKGSKLGAKCRLSRVVVMDNVTVGDNCVLQNCVLGTGCSVGESCSLNDCQVAPGNAVLPGTKLKGEGIFDETADLT